MPTPPAYWKKHLLHTFDARRLRREADKRLVSKFNTLSESIQARLNAVCSTSPFGASHCDKKVKLANGEVVVKKSVVGKVVSSLLQTDDEVVRHFLQLLLTELELVSFEHGRHIHSRASKYLKSLTKLVRRKRMVADEALGGLLDDVLRKLNDS